MNNAEEFKALKSRSEKIKKILSDARLTHSGALMEIQATVHGLRDKPSYFSEVDRAVQDLADRDRE